MKKIFFPIIAVLLFYSWKPNAISDFNPGQTIIYKPVDISQAPVYKKISSKGAYKPEYKYLDSVDVFSITHLSDSLKITGFMVAPKVKGKYPCIIYNRGGNRDYGQLLVATAVEFMAPIAARGYVVIASNYRGAANCDGKDEFGGRDVNDVINLMNSLSEIPFADTSRIGMFGVSRGGMMTYLALTKTTRIKAAVISGGIADAFLNSSNPDHPDMITVYEELVPGFKQNKDSVLKTRSATYWVEKMNPSTPILILHGTSDKKVSIKEPEKLVEELKKYKRTYKYVPFEKDDHGINKNKAEAYRLAIEWFKAYL